jgi:hypothetical protein
VAAEIPASVAAIYRIERINYVLGAGVIVAGLLTQSRSIALGLAVGVALTCANFFVLRRLVFKWTREAATGGQSNSAILALPKMLVLMLAVAGAILLLPIDPIAFTIGYSIFIVSIIFDATLTALRAPHDLPDPTANGTDEHHG